jgi:hypothetical protein
MKIIKVKKVTKHLPMPQIEYYREKGGPLLAYIWKEWTVCSKDGEPSYAIDPNQYRVEIVA